MIYFYPKAFTPGCTTEACNFRDNIYAFRAIGANVVGVSVDGDRLVETAHEIAAFEEVIYLVICTGTHDLLVEVVDVEVGQRHGRNQRGPTLTLESFQQKLEAPGSVDGLELVGEVTHRGHHACRTRSAGCSEGAARPSTSSPLH